MHVSQLYYTMVSNSSRNEAKKYFSDYVVLKLSIAVGKKTDPSLTTKSTKTGENLFLSSCLEDTKGVLTIQRHRILNREMVEKCIGLELDTQVGTNQQDPDMITNNTVSAYDWSILIRGIRSSRMYFTVMIGKDVKDIRIRIKLFALVHKDIFVFHERPIDLQSLT